MLDIEVYKRGKHRHPPGQDVPAGAGRLRCDHRFPCIKSDPPQICDSLGLESGPSFPACWFFAYKNDVGDRFVRIHQGNSTCVLVKHADGKDNDSFIYAKKDTPIWRMFMKEITRKEK